jgi:hypothetical protein
VGISTLEVEQELISYFKFVLIQVTSTAREHNRSGEFYTHPIIKEILLENVMLSLKSQPVYSFLILKNNNIINAN